MKLVSASIEAGEASGPPPRLEGLKKWLETQRSKIFTIVVIFIVAMMR